MKRVEILKTYKIYSGGKFPRTESGRYYLALDKKGNPIANMCMGSRKDVRNAVVSARKALGAWSGKTAFNRSQILYRIAEVLEGRKSQFVEELILQGSQKNMAIKEVEDSIDRIVYYAGWCDKFCQIGSSVNPVSSSHFNFSTYEPVGVVGLIAPQDSSLLGLVSLLMPIIAGGNTCVVLANESLPLCSITFSEVLHASDVPGGAVNIITGHISELIKPLSTHMDVNALAFSGLNELKKEIDLFSVENLKRVRSYDLNWKNTDTQGLHYITDFQEVKTTWHPIENIGGATSTY
ncbi:aldehyde dehydrogenase family protein [Crocinitomicaceae bacterium]|nr:aldehyde dehydrogenase family protein [Crocinitomicaceae bacterium]